MTVIELLESKVEKNGYMCILFRILKEKDVTVGK